VQSGRQEALQARVESEELLMTGSTGNRAVRLTVLTSLVTVGLALAAFVTPSVSSAAIELEAFSYATSELGGSPQLRSSAHPEGTIATFEFAKNAKEIASESPRDISVDLPAGAIGNPAAIPTCTNAKLTTNSCTPESQVGVVRLYLAGQFVESFAIFNLVAPPGVLAQFGFYALTTPVHLTATIHSAPQYGVTITTRQTPQTLAFFKVENEFWGVPAASSHDELRVPCLGLFGPTGAKCPSEASEVLPFLTNPSACSASSLAVSRVDSWLEPTIFAEAVSGNVDGSGNLVGVDGCAVPDFSPTTEARPSAFTADSPTGLHVNLHLPQDETPEGRSEAQLRDATLVFPKGMTVNSASAAGLEGCTPAQVGVMTAVGDPDARFDESAVTCPTAAKLGSVQVKTPVLKEPLQGAIYLASQDQNPFGSLLALYIVVEDPLTGVIIKIAGEAKPDPLTGQLTVSFPTAPQLPFEDLDVDLFKGPRAALKTPLVCGTYTSQSTLVPWTAPEGPERHPGDSFQITAAAAPGLCPTSESAAPNSPNLIAGAVNPAAGSYSPFTLRLARNDGSQPIKGLEATLPKGLLGRLAGVSYCPDAALAAAAANSGKAELASFSCPAASQVGTVTVGAGAGSEPLYVPGKAYLAGPYKGAPLSLAIVTPAVAGPFDLGSVVVRNALNLDPVTTQIHVVSDPIPTILQGIPLDIRSIAVNVDRPNFTLNPTNCEQSQVGASVLSVFDQSAPLSIPFAVGGCDALKFRPKLKLSLKGQTKRTGNPSVRAVLTAPPGEANIARTTVLLPSSQFIDNRHINGPCTRVQFAEGAGNGSACPPSSILGTAKAYSPLLEAPLEGPVYFRSNGGERKLPDLVASLGGQIHVNLVGYIDSVKAGKDKTRVRTRFAEVPDAPVSRFELRLYGGRRGLIQNSKNLCTSEPMATVQMNGQNGKIADSQTRIQTSCGGKKKHKHSKHHRKG
jgi:hypothetical protein